MFVQDEHTASEQYVRNWNAIGLTAAAGGQTSQNMFAISNPQSYSHGISKPANHRRHNLVNNQI